MIFLKLMNFLHSSSLVIISLLIPPTDSVELDGPSVSALRRAITEVKQSWSVIGRVTKNLLSRVPPCFEMHVKPLVPAALCSR
jgi:hypothetical protein